MIIKQPSDISVAWADRFNARDKSALMALYDEQAMLTLDGAVQVHGKSEIEKALAPMLASPGKAICKCVSCWQAGDTALVRNDWQMVDAKGAVVMKGLSAEVLKRDPTHGWRFLIDDATYVSR
jgi:ketosteroid isomerase-like protein